MAQFQNALYPALTFCARCPLASIAPDDGIAKHSFGVIIGGIDAALVKEDKQEIQSPCQYGGAIRPAIVFSHRGKARSTGRALHKKHSILPGWEALWPSGKAAEARWCTRRRIWRCPDPFCLSILWPCGSDVPDRSGVLKPIFDRRRNHR